MVRRKVDGYQERIINRGFVADPHVIDNFGSRIDFIPSTNEFIMFFPASSKEKLLKTLLILSITFVWERIQGNRTVVRGKVDGYQKRLVNRGFVVLDDVPERI